LEKQVAIYDVAGPLFFGAAQKAVGSLGAIGESLKVVIIRLDHVPIMDATGLVALESAIATLSKRGCLAILTGLQKQPAGLIGRAGLESRGWRVAVEPNLSAALQSAKQACEPGR
jgi:SulP family sulfate permease